VIIARGVVKQTFVFIFESEHVVPYKVVQFAVCAVKLFKVPFEIVALETFTVLTFISGDVRFETIDIFIKFAFEAFNKLTFIKGDVKFESKEMLTTLIFVPDRLSHTIFLKLARSDVVFGVVIVPVTTRFVTEVLVKLVLTDSKRLETLHVTSDALLKH
jgi:hypothetical protein